MTAKRDPSMSTGLDASTVTPGRMPPVLSVTCPVMLLWAYAAAGSVTANAAIPKRWNTCFMTSPPSRADQPSAS